MTSRSFNDSMTLDPARLREVSAAVREKAEAIGRASADQMAGTLRRAYPSVTETLRNGVQSGLVNGRPGVRTSATHANAYERGTPPRQRKSGASTGQMTRANVFVPLAVRTRRGFYRDVQAMLNENREIT